MGRAFLVCLMITNLSGCDLLEATVPIPVPQSPSGVIIIEGFGTSDSLIVGTEWFKLPGYYSFKQYDSIRINFAGDKLVPSGVFDHVVVKVGPAKYCQDSLVSLHKEFSIFVIPAKIAKPTVASVTFFVPDSGRSLLLSHLRVVGWQQY